jgi:hypothetical protein
MQPFELKELPFPMGSVLEERVDLSVTSQNATVLSLPPVMNISRSLVKKTVDPRILPGCAHQLVRSANSELNCCGGQ